MLASSAKKKASSKTPSIDSFVTVTQRDPSQSQLIIMPNKQGSIDAGIKKMSQSNEATHSLLEMTIIADLLYCEKSPIELQQIHQDFVFVECWIWPACHRLTSTLLEERRKKSERSFLISSTRMLMMDLTKKKLVNDAQTWGLSFLCSG